MDRICNMRGRDEKYEIFTGKLNRHLAEPGASKMTVLTLRLPD